MNIEILKIKMAEHFDNISPEEIISKFEAMGYSFVEITPKEPDTVHGNEAEKMFCPNCKSKRYNISTTWYRCLECGNKWTL